MGRRKRKWKKLKNKISMENHPTPFSLVAPQPTPRVPSPDPIPPPVIAVPVQPSPQINHGNLTTSDATQVFNGSHKIAVSKNGGGTVEAKYNGKEIKPEATESIEESINKLKRKIYKDFISMNCQNLVILTGAGSSVSEGGPTMKHLWDHVVVPNQQFTIEQLNNLGIQVKMLSVDESFENYPDDKKDLEKFLSKLTMAKEFVANATEIERFIKMAEEKIIDKCSLNIKERSPVLDFLRKISSRNLKFPRVKLFTLNYDTIFEQAASAANFVLIDGFSFSHPRVFTPTVYDMDIIFREKTRVNDEPSFFPNVIQFYKPHGSLNWIRNDNKIIQVKQTKGSEKPVLIYPKDSKYESSYEQPFFEMMSRFQRALREENTLLITIGFSFSDKHFRNSIVEAIEQYPSFHLLVVNKSLWMEGDMKRIADQADRRDNIMLVAESFDDFIENFPSPTAYNSNSNQSIKNQPDEEIAI